MGFVHMKLIFLPLWKKEASFKNIWVPLLELFMDFFSPAIYLPALWFSSHCIFSLYFWWYINNSTSNKETSSWLSALLEKKPNTANMSFSIKQNDRSWVQLWHWVKHSTLSLLLILLWYELWVFPYSRLPDSSPRFSTLEITGIKEVVSRVKPRWWTINI